MSIRVVPGEPAPDASSGCKRCHHPLALHSNGETECKAFACSAGDPALHDTCMGRGCDDCKGTGLVSLPCPGFTAAAEGARLAS